MKRIILASSIVVGLAACSTQTTTQTSATDDILNCGIALLATGSFSVSQLLAAAVATPACMHLPKDVLDGLVNKSASTTAMKRGVRMVP